MRGRVFPLRPPPGPSECIYMVAKDDPRPPADRNRRSDERYGRGSTNIGLRPLHLLRLLRRSVPEGCDHAWLQLRVVSLQPGRDLLKFEGTIY